eukprot:GFKZ01007645.1.p1 GENE.GFKZ01007645.1~~GFKZ01007645.1.p1  ORF type:complete len:639 (-),score=59.51 GFKZ01007645.1:279-2195(-)
MSPHLLLVSLFLYLFPLGAASPTPPHTLPAHILLPSVRATGQTLESCEATSECQPPRQCLSTTDLNECSSPPCICIPDISLLPCSSSTDCEEGEVCAAGIPGISFNCVSDAVVEENPELRQVNANTDPPLPGGGFTLDQCRTDLQCTDSRICVLPDPRRVEPCRSNSPACVCAPPAGLESCDNSSQCIDEEVCVGGVIDGESVCIAELVNDALPEQFPELDEDPDADGPADQGSDDGDGGETGPGGDEDTDPAPGDGTGSDAGGAPASQGLTLDPCETGSDCLGFRGCFTDNGLLCIEEPDAQCTCGFPNGLVFCGTSEHCIDGEVCVEGTALGFDFRGVCVSPLFAASFDTVVVIDEEDGRGVTAAPCFKDGGCLGERTCVTPLGGAVDPCPANGEPCVCFPPDGPQTCESSAECEELELCLIGLGVDEPTCAFDLLLEIDRVEEYPTPMPQPPSPSVAAPSNTPDGTLTESPGASPGGTEPSEPGTPEPNELGSPEASEEDPAESPEVQGPPSVSPSPSMTPVPFVCVDARLLEGMKKEELVFEEHAMTTVLCDKMGSCATPGHIVVWNGSSMMMRSYCGVAGGCEEVQMEVNSPRWRKKLRVVTRTSGLEFTAFAAKYATRGEEMALTALVRVGL